VKRAGSTGPPEADGDARLIEGLAGWLTARLECRHVTITELTRPTSGYSSETIFFDACWDQGGSPCENSLVLRMAPRGHGSFADYNLVPQFEAQMAARAVGVPIADPMLETDPDWVGAPFILMPRMNGRVIGQLPHLDPWIASLSGHQRRSMYDEFLRTLAAIHGAHTRGIPHVPRRDNAAELDYWQEYLSWSCNGHPVPGLVEALEWCRRNRPDKEPAAALLWGDVRFENCVIGDDCRIRAVLDWDMASVGAPEHDLAWLTSLDFTMHHLVGQRVDGFPDRKSTVARFEELSGRPMIDFEWYETFAMVRSTAIMTRLSFLRQEAGKPVLLPLEQNPVLDLLLTRLS
jgi:aminoglycoside phosphotransferase (APT) family kinase protein